MGCVDKPIKRGEVSERGDKQFILQNRKKEIFSNNSLHN